LKIKFPLQYITEKGRKGILTSYKIFKGKQIENSSASSIGEKV
jgi:hypothetical protein